MTWREFKAWMADQGVQDDDLIEMIDFVLEPSTIHREQQNPGEPFRVIVRAQDFSRHPPFA